MKKQSGFTLIELMVVMAIIAILATAGLSAYTGYIKKARDATRIADLSAINTIVLGGMSTMGKPPQTAVAVLRLMEAANNKQPIRDPLASGGTLTNHKDVCLEYVSGGIKTCVYTYRLCDGGAGYAIGANFESESNRSLKGEDAIGNASSDIYDSDIYEIGSCNQFCTQTYPGCSGLAENSCPTLFDAGEDYLECGF